MFRASLRDQERHSLPWFSGVGSVARLLPDQQQRIEIACPMSSEAINAIPGAKWGETRIVTNETKLAITDGAARGSGRSRIFLAARHRNLRLALDFYLSAFLFYNPTQSACVLFRRLQRLSVRVGLQDTFARFSRS
jgi:hypothetical protein